MKPQLTGTRKRLCATKPPGAEAAPCLQEELVAAIHGAFEVAVEIAVREVRKLVGQATSDIYVDLRRENESLKQRLQRAEALLEERGGSPPPAAELLSATKHADQSPHLNCNQRSPNLKVDCLHRCTGVKGDTPSAGHRGADQPPDPQHAHLSRNEEKSPSSDVKTLCVSDAASEPEDEHHECTKEVTEEISHVCVVKVESMNPPCQDLGAEACDLPPFPSIDSNSCNPPVTVKQEKPEEEKGGSSCCLDSIKVEDFSLECMSAVQSKMLEEWQPGLLDIQSQDPNARLSGSGLDQAHSQNPTSIQPPTDLPSLSSEFPNIFQLEELVPTSEAAPQVYGVHVRTSRNLSHTVATLYTCKFCGQTFNLPSFLRRHYGQCRQRLQQRCQQPVVGSKRTRLQLYPPGCSPFRCTECNREFNRMENLKTHLRIHTGERPYTCSVCSKCFRHSGALTRHFRIHTGEKPYICGQCGKSFRNCGGLKFHQRSHSKQLQ